MLGSVWPCLSGDVIRWFFPIRLLVCTKLSGMSVIAEMTVVVAGLEFIYAPAVPGVGGRK